MEWINLPSPPPPPLLPYLTQSRLPLCSHALFFIHFSQSTDHFLSGKEKEDSTGVDEYEGAKQSPSFLSLFLLLHKRQSV